jgi:predicted patatin/cPLA2 family phospholipase
MNTYIKSLIENIPPEQVVSNTGNVTKIDLVLDGGAFNGMFMIGSLFYIKELEDQNKIIIDRISGCSIGAFLGAMYLLNRMDLAKELTVMCITKIRKHQDLKQMMKLVRYRLCSYITESDVTSYNNRFYLTYFDTNKGKQIIKKNYDSLEDLVDSIIKSMYVPYLIDRNVVDKDGCIDGAFPYMFKKDLHKKILFINLQGLDKIFKMIYIKHEKNIYPRMMEGLRDTHNFICTGHANSLCSYVNDWNIGDIFYFRMRESLYTTLFYLFRTVLQLEQFIPKKLKNKNIIKQNAFILKNLWNDIIIYLSLQ